MTNNLFERIGGMDAVNAAVDIFYKKVINDESINHFFKGVDMVNQSGKMKMFLAYAFGAPMKYSGTAMRDAHKHMNLTEEHFTTVATHLVATLNDLSVAPHLIDEVVQIVLSVKSDVLNQ